MEKMMTCNVYSDGSHFIGIPCVSNPNYKRSIYEKKFIIITEEFDNSFYINENFIDFFSKRDHLDYNSCLLEFYSKDSILLSRKVEIREYFNELCLFYFNLNDSDLKKNLYSIFIKHFNNSLSCLNFINTNLERIKNNFLTRKTRLYRKAYFNSWNYFTTFTYDSNKLKEEDFKRKLKICLSHLCNRKNWRYIGVWERSVKKRLHFHCLLYIPDGKLVGTFVSKKDFSFSKHNIQIANENTFFLKRFGRNDFKKIYTSSDLKSEINYMCKYITKTNCNIVYSRGLKDKLKCDVSLNDVITTYGVDNRKLILFDDNNLLLSSNL